MKGYNWNKIVRHRRKGKEGRNENVTVEDVISCGTNP